MLRPLQSGGDASIWSARKTVPGWAVRPDTIKRMSRELSGGNLLDAAIARIVSDALAEWDRIQEDVPDLLYHYTDVAGLIGICSSGSPLGNEPALHERREGTSSRVEAHA